MNCISNKSTDYNLNFHVASIFLLTLTSLLGSVSPVLYQIYHPGRPGSHFIFKLGLLFGAGTILATGFIHCLIPSIFKLTHPCLGPFWSRDYQAFAGLFAIISMLSMQLIQLLLSSYYSNLIKTSSPPTTEDLSSHDISEHVALNHVQSTDHSCKDNSHVLNKRITVVLLEIGIASHSVIIGITLGVSTGSEFVALLIALCFHQFFEGLALGSTIAEAKFRSNIKSLLMAGVYGITTPLGIGIGIAIHRVYVPNSVESLLVTGILDAVSAGILIYTALVEFITPEITKSKDFQACGWFKKSLQLGALYLGVATMALIGRFA